MPRNETTTWVFRKSASGDEAAAAEIVRRYGDRLRSVADRKIGRRLRKRLAGEDVVQSMFEMFFRRSRSGAWSINRSGQLWSLLVTLTLRQVERHAEHETAQKRDVRREEGMEALTFSEVVGDGLAVDAALMIADEIEHLLGHLNASDSAQLQAWLAGDEIEEAAKNLGCSRSTVQRARRRVRAMIAGRIDEVSKSVLRPSGNDAEPVRSGE